MALVRGRVLDLAIRRGVRRPVSSLSGSCSRSYTHYSPGAPRRGKNWWYPLRPFVATSLSLSLFSKGRDLDSDGSRRKTTPRSYNPQPALPSSAPIEVSRVMLPDDTNPHGNVHGGTILKLIEQAGHIVATRYYNKNCDGKDACVAALVRVDHMDFVEPMYVGEVAQLQAAVTYTSPHSMEVTVDVWAENILTGTHRHTNTATLWYVAVPVNGTKKLMAVPIPPLKELSPVEMEKGRQRYEAQKAERLSSTTGKEIPVSYHAHNDEEVHTVLASQSTLANVVLPSDCTSTGHFMGGALMKMMDSAAGMCAVRHCRSPVVTACIDAINFNETIMNGEVVFVTARPVFTSTRSIDIEVKCVAEGRKVGSRRVASTAYFTFVSIGKDRHAIPIPPLKLKTNEERQRFEEGQKRYEARKKKRRGT